MLYPGRAEHIARASFIAIAALVGDPAIASPTTIAPNPIDARAFDVRSVTPKGVVELAVDPVALDVVRSGQPVTIPDVPVTATARHTLHLRPFEVFTADARLVHTSADIQTPAPLPSITLLRGTIDADPSSFVYLAVSDKAINGFLEIGDASYLISSGKDPGASPVVFEPRSEALADDDTQLPPCGAEELPEYHAALADFTRPSVDRGGSTGPLPRRLVRVAIDTDAEFVEMYATPDDCAAYVATLLGAVSSVYRREINADLQISYLELRTSADDPWTETSAQGQLAQFRLYWLANRGSVQRDVAHLLCQRAFTGAGGTAYLNGLCSDLAFGISGYLNGFFPVPLQNNQAQNWDAYVVTHEIGHNFGAPHTHQMAPPIDTCGLGDCSDAPAGTIMSYCHTCSGALRNIRFDFHPRIIEERIAPFLDGLPCALAASAACVSDFDENGRVGGPDLAFLLSNFFTHTPAPFVGGDLNGDAFINGSDLSVILRTFGQTCD